MLLSATMLAGALLTAVPAEFGTALQVDANSTAAPCALDLRIPGQIAWRGVCGRGYEATSGQALEQADVSVVHEGPACRWFVTGERPSSGAVLSGPGGSLNYDVLRSTDSTTILSEDVQGSFSTRFEGEFQQGMDAATLSLFVTIPPGQVVRAGAYSGETIIRLYRVGDGAPELIAQAPLSISAAVPPMLSVSSRDFAPGAVGGTVSLGDLEAGVSKSIGFDVTSNADVSISFVSAGGGRLRHQYNAPGVPYRLVAGGRVVNLAATGSVERFSASQETPLVLDMVIEVDPGPAAAGQYQDELLVTFTAEG